MEIFPPSTPNSACNPRAPTVRLVNLFSELCFGVDCAPICFFFCFNFLYNSTMPKSRYSTMPKSRYSTILVRKQRSSMVKLHDRSLTIKRSAITAPRTRSYRPYFLRSSGSPSYKHTMDEVKVLRDRDLWAGGLEKMLVDMLYQETLEGKLVGSKITNRDTIRLATRLNELGIKLVDSSQVKEKIIHLKKTQRQFTDLMGQTGMGWNPITKTIIATEEHWANAIRVRSQWKKFKTNGCANYDVLCKIFGQAVATGVLHYTLTQEPSFREEQRLEDELRARGPVLGTSTRLDSIIDLDDIEITPSTQRGVPQPTNPCKRCRDETLQTIATNSKARAYLDTKMFEICSSKCSRVEGSNSGYDAGYSSVAQCMKFLQDITPPLPMDVHLRAVKAFMDPNILVVFQNMTPALRLEWVWSLR